MEANELEDRIARVPTWYHRIELAPGVVTPGTHDSPFALGMLPLPEDCTGLRALDVGARDGFYTFELERRGAEVVAIDYAPAEATGFALAAEVLGSRAEWHHANVYDVTPERYGRFDIVLFLGVLYHLRNPLRALDLMRDVCDRMIVVETQVLDHHVVGPDGAIRSLADYGAGLDELALAQFYPGSELSGDATNWWAPNAACLRGLLQAACFDVDHLEVHGARAVARGVPAAEDERFYQRRIEGAVW